MMSMVRIARLAIALAGACLIAFTAGIVLSRLHAGTGWFYGLAILLTAVVGLRTLAPGSGISIDGFHRQDSRRSGRHKHLPSPLG